MNHAPSSKTKQALSLVLKTLKRPIYLVVIGLGCASFFPMVACNQAADADTSAVATPASLGFDPEGLLRAQQQLEVNVDNQTLAGVVTLIARKGVIVHEKAYGVQDLDTGLPMQMNTIFRLASMTKPITTVALMQLVEQGKISLDDPVSTYIPAFSKMQVMDSNGNRRPAQVTMTVRHIMSHTSGISATEFSSGALQKAFLDSGMAEVASLEALVDRISSVPLAHEPGAQWTYGLSTDVVGRIVEVVSGVPFEKYLFENLLIPLNLTDTFFAVPEEKINRLSSVYSASDEGLQKRPSSTRVRFPRGVGGLFSTTYDYFRFTQMILNGGTIDGVEILKPESVQLMSTNILPTSQQPISVMGLDMPNNGFGLGFSVVTDNQPSGPDAKGFWWNKGGAPPIGSIWWIGALQTYFWIDPGNEIIGILMTQSPDLMPFDYKQQFHTMIYEAYR